MENLGSIYGVIDQKDNMSNGDGLLLIGEHEVQVLSRKEVELHKHFDNCEKNPGHPEFVPINSFRKEHLPEGHRHDNSLYEVVKAVADLTVRVGVKMTSPNRPEFWPKTKIPYFLSELSGEKTLRTGTGRIMKVKKFSDEDKQFGYTTCSCNKCISSDEPSKVWWKIYVLTAAHVVFDDTEASQTTLRLFFDSKDSQKVFLKDKVCVDDVSIENDRCLFTCVTCDENLGNKLKKMVDHFVDLWRKVRDKHKESRDIEKLNFIVSHPHGCSKQVSVGQWKDKVQMGRREYPDHKFTYTTCTCPGSSGANVHCVGYYNSWFTDLVHSGFLKPGLNYSGASYVW